MDTHDDTQHPVDRGEDTPDDLNPQTLRKVLDKARRRATVRNVSLSVLAVGVLAVAGVVINGVWTGGVASRLPFQVGQQLSLQYPDLYMGTYHFSLGVLGGNLDIGTFDLVDGTPTPGPTWQFQYSVFGGLSYPGGGGDMSPAPQFGTPDGTRMFNDQTEQPIMEFYLPGVTYAQHFNDLSKLKQIPAQDHVEMALSFNRDYSFQQVNAMLPAGMHPSWYWVDTYSASERRMKNPFPFTSGIGTIVGFPRLAYADPSAPSQTPADFLAMLKSGLNGPTLWREQDQQILKTLAHGTGKPTASDVKISGVVVTGTPTSLQSLQGETYIRASSLGAIAPPF